MNEEYLVSAGHHPALNTSLPFVHTARRSYRLSGPVRLWDLSGKSVSLVLPGKLSRTLSFRGRRSRNKVSVGEPAEGSFIIVWLRAIRNTYHFCGYPLHSVSCGYLALYLGVKFCGHRPYFGLLVRLSCFGGDCGC